MCDCIDQVVYLARPLSLLPPRDVSDGDRAAKHEIFWREPRVASVMMQALVTSLALQKLPSMISHNAVKQLPDLLATIETNSDHGF